MAVVQSSKDKMNIIMSTPPPCRQGSEFSRISLLHPLSPLPLSLSLSPALNMQAQQLIYGALFSWLLRCKRKERNPMTQQDHALYLLKRKREIHVLAPSFFSKDSSLYFDGYPFNIVVQDEEQKDGLVELLNSFNIFLSK